MTSENTRSKPQESPVAAAWADHLAQLFADRRVVGANREDGNPEPHVEEQNLARFHMGDMRAAGWRQLDTDGDTLDRVAHAIHQVQCGCDGSLHSDTNPDLSPRMAEVAIRELLGGDQ